jgi:UDP-N-acetylmuramate: L-alanyl-gamma-D-glutamyl-meso-diaminopimelate ligase
MHVLKKENKDFDYLVGAGLEGFEQSVKITNAPLIICEGDEYPASTIEKRPKFHFLAPHIALITGIAWDHINVFPTFENYLAQFRIFIEKIETGGYCIYNETDRVLKELIETSTRIDIQFIPYALPTYFIENSITSIVIEGEKESLQVFGAHNLLNMHAAWKACQLLNISASSFVKAISSFKGASKRMELLAGNKHTRVFRDFAHAPSKAKATIEAVKEQFPDKKLIAVFELHTYSSLSESFMNEYDGIMNNADAGVVFYSQHALELKRLSTLDPGAVREGFGKKSLEVFSNRKELEQWLKEQDYKNTVLLFMSSGSFEGINLEQLASAIVHEE